MMLPHTERDILKALAQPTRLKILDFLSDGESCICKIFPAISEELSNNSRHLNMMLGSGIRSRRKERIKIVYDIKHPEALQILDLAEQIMASEVSGRQYCLSGGKP